MKTKHLLRIVLLSSGDVKEEQQVMQDIIREANRGIADDRNLWFELSRWETGPHPGFHSEGPQGLIDPILKIEECDILLGIFWKRFGTPTKKAQSGTEYEMRAAIQSWQKSGHPQVMVYFKESEFMPQDRAELNQFDLLLRFREEFPKEGLYWTFKDVHDFERLARNHLTNFIRSRYSLVGSETKLEPQKKVNGPARSSLLMPRVFLCHSSDDKPVVRELYGRLAESGVKPWLDEFNILPGQDWEFEIKQAIQQADAVIVLLSRKSTTKRGYLQREIRTALETATEQPEGSIFLIPARLEDCEVPDSLRKWQYVDLFKPNAFERLLESLKHCKPKGEG